MPYDMTLSLARAPFMPPMAGCWPLLQALAVSASGVSQTKLLYGPGFFKRVDHAKKRGKALDTGKRWAVRGFPARRHAAMRPWKAVAEGGTTCATRRRSRRAHRGTRAGLQVGAPSTSPR